MLIFLAEIFILIFAENAVFSVPRYKGMFLDIEPTQVDGGAA